MNKEESKRIHMDWWGKCRTCEFWQCSDEERMAPGTCTNQSSVLYQQETWTDGYCVKWDSFDIETALEMLESEP